MTASARSSGIDVERERAATPGCRHRIHFNNAGAALMSTAVLATMVDYLRFEACIGGYEAADARADDLDAIYGSLAALLGAAPDEVAVTDSATRAFQAAFSSLRFVRGDRILISESDYISHHLMYHQLALRQGVRLDVVPHDEAGRTSVDALADLMDDRVRLVVVGHIATNDGTVHPVAEIGALLRGSDALFLVDACQSVGQIPLDVDQLGCDVLVGTGRKYLRGPRGTGFLYARSAVLDRLEPPLPDLRGAWFDECGTLRLRPDGTRFETWEFDHAAKLGLAAAIEHAQRISVEAIAAEVTRLASRLRSGLAERAGVGVREGTSEPSGLVTFNVQGWDAAIVRERLSARRINVSVAVHRHTPTRIRRGDDDWIRASVHYFNTEDEIDAFLAAVDAILASTRVADGRR